MRFLCRSAVAMTAASLAGGVVAACPGVASATQASAASPMMCFVCLDAAPLGHPVGNHPRPGCRCGAPTTAFTVASHGSAPLTA